ncbi:acyl carrier protein [Clostridiaceae bacterium]|nr:acyl carrier protein [Clostridiaceae bacterium]
MSNYEKYEKAFVESFEISPEEAKKLTYQGIPAWDSVGHMDLIATLEETFDIMMETDDIIDFNSFDKGIEILGKYHINMD